MSKLSFSGSVSHFLGMMILNYILCIVTCGLYFPWATVAFHKWKASYTSLNGVPFRFTGSGTELFGKFIIWYLLSILTCGIYSIWAMVDYEKWVITNTEYGQ